MTHGGNVWQGDRPGTWLDHSANVRPGGPPEWVLEAVRQAADALEFYPQLSMARARAALGEYLGLAPDRVLPTAGGISAITLAARLGCGRVRIPAPSFTEYAAISRRFGLTVESVPLLNEDRSVRPLSALAEDLAEGTCLWLCNPNNPIGVGFAAEEVMELHELLRRKNGALVVDEAFIAYCPENSVAALAAERDNFLVTGSMTKILGVPGIRLGYLCGGPALREAESWQTPWELNCFAEAVLLALPDHRDDVAAECERSRRRREDMRRTLEALGVYVYPSDANYLLIDVGRDVVPLRDYLRDRHILVRECMDFTAICDGRHLRLAVKDEKSNDTLIETLREAMACAENH